jgi:hypothetical protein
MVGGIWIAAGLALVLSAGQWVLIGLAMNSSAAVLSRFVVPPMTLSASLVAAFLAWQVAADLPADSSMRRGWWLMTASAAMAVVRYFLELVAEYADWKVATDPIISLRQVPGVVSLMLLLASLVLIWRSFARMGLGLSPRKPDLLAILALLLLLPPIIWYRRSLEDAGSIYLLFRYLQFSQPFLLAITGGFAVVLLRIAEEAGDGQLARSLRYLAYFLILRLVLMMSAIVPAIQQFVPFRVIRVGTFGVAPWLFTLAIAYRWQLTESARAALRRIASAASRTDRARLALSK